MSVINQMLKDLDQRQAPVSSPARGRHPKRRQGPSPWLWLALVVAALVFFFFGLPEYGQKPPRLIDTPGNKEPRVYVLRPGEPATSQPATATSTAATASSTVATTDAPEQPAVSPSADTAAKGNTSVSANTAALNTITQPATPATQPELSDLSTPLTVASVPALSAAPTPATPKYQVATAPHIDTKVPQDTPVSSSNASVDARAADAQVAALSRSNDFPAPASTPAASMSVQRLDKTPEVPSPWLQQANDAMLQGNWSLARQRWQQVLVQQPTLTEGYLQLATVLDQQQDWSALQALLHQAQQHGVSHARLELAQLRLLAASQQWQPLLSSLTPALESQGGVVLALKAKAQQQLGQWQAAALTYQQWQRQEPSQARAFLGEALLLEQQGQVQAARPKFQHALTLGGLAPQTTHYIQQRLSTQGSD